jgi:hypothetical protein
VDLLCSQVNIQLFTTYLLWPSLFSKDHPQDPLRIAWTFLSLMFWNSNSSLGWKIITQNTCQFQLFYTECSPSQRKSVTVQAIDKDDSHNTNLKALMLNMPFFTPTNLHCWLFLCILDSSSTSFVHYSFSFSWLLH